MKNLEEYKYKAKYDGVWRGVAFHPQVDMGEFSCDEEMVPFVRAIQSVGLHTKATCQNTSDTGYKSWYIPRRLLSYTHPNPKELLRFCLHLKSRLRDSGWNQEMCVDNYFHPPDPTASSYFTNSLDEDVLKAILSYRPKLLFQIKSFFQKPEYFSVLARNRKWHI